MLSLPTFNIDAGSLCFHSPSQNVLHSSTSFSFSMLGQILIVHGDLEVKNRGPSPSQSMSEAVRVVQPEQGNQSKLRSSMQVPYR